MTQSVIIKSSKNGLVLVLNEDLPFDTLVEEVKNKFSESRDFFGSAVMTIGFAGRKMSAVEEAQILETVEACTDLKFKYIEEDDNLSDIRMHGMLDKFYYEDIMSNAKIYPGSVTKDQIIESDSSLIVLGDVKSKATVRAKGNVIVLGNLDGNVYAATESNGKDSYVIAGFFNASYIEIGDFTGPIETHDSFFKRFKKENSDMAIVGVYENKLILEPMRAGYLNQIKDKL